MLFQTPFQLITYHKALKYTFEKYVQGRFTRWLEFMAEHIFKGKYQLGAINNTSDILPRYANHEETLEEFEDDGELTLLTWIKLEGFHFDFETILIKMHRKRDEKLA